MKEVIKKFIPEIILNQYRRHTIDAKKKKALQLYEGTAVICSICNSEFKEFGEFGLSKRKNAQCHKCNSLERHRLSWKYINERTDLLKSTKRLRLLHFAPEKVFYDIFSAHQNIEYYPCDLMPEKYSFSGNVKVSKADITDIPFENDFFDVIICNHVLEHIPNDALAMSELYRVLKKKGWAILQVPIDYSREKTYEDFSITKPEEREKAFGQNDHVRWYGRDYKDRLRKSGFKVNEDDFVKTFSEDEIFRFGFISSELIYYCEK
ncbi:MAG: class I SAM-dependent methyltransferase [Saprospiraceae bacterium]